MGYPRVKILAFCDLCITEDLYRQAFQDLVAQGAELRIMQWELADLQDLRAKVIQTERQGPQAVPYPAGAEAEARDANVLVTHICPVPRKLIDAAGRLEVIGCARSGVENVDVAAATQRRIPVLNCPTSKISTAADATVGMMLAECRSLARAHRDMMQGVWDARFAFFGGSMGLSGRKVGLVGFGNIGQAVAQRLQGFGVQMLVYDPYQPESVIRQLGGAPSSLSDLLKNADFVVVLARLEEGTRNLIGMKELGMMKQTAFFINTARAGLVDYAALRVVLQEGRIAGAALDVFDTEPLGLDDPLLKLQNVTLTPHVAGVSRSGYLRSALDVAEDLVRLYESRSAKHVVNPEALQGAGRTGKEI
jgi:D-3-phosphoglycerate dehydrogenase / 2-oxoglutarate reductase